MEESDEDWGEVKGGELVVTEVRPAKVRRMGEGRNDV